MSTILQRIAGFPALARERLASRSDSEHEMAFNRIVIATIFMFGAWIFEANDASFDITLSFRFYIAYCLASLCIIVAILVRPQAARVRRLATMALDLGAGTFASHIAGPTGIGFLYPCYLLIIYGYGFRYGANWLVLSSAGAFASLATVAAFSPHWDQQHAMIGGLLIGLLIIPAYAYQLVRKLWAAKAQAEASNRAKSLFVASVSHDLRTPLNAIIGLGDLLASSKIPHEEAEMARMIGGAGRSLLGLIDSILDFSRQDMGRTEITYAPVDLHAMLCGLRDLLGVSAEAKGVCLSLRAKTEFPRWIETSERHIKDSLTNLIGNAIKFTDVGRVEIVVSSTLALDGRTQLRFEIHDTGIGVSPKAQSRIFDQFTQANENIRDNYGGTGLGLAIVRQLVNALHGRLGVASAEGRGSVFWFEIDAQLASPTQEVAPPPAPALLVFSCDANLIACARRVSGDVRATADGLELTEAAAKMGGPFALVVDQDMASAAVEPWVAAAVKSAAQQRAGLIQVQAHEEMCHFPAPLAPLIADLADRSDASALRIAIAFVMGPPAAHVDAPVARLGESHDILVVEDNKTNQKVIEKMLMRAGHRVTIADNGEHALQWLAQRAFALVLMDINMPVLGGIEATIRLRARENGDNPTPVIALTADVTPETRAKCQEAGMSDCLTKPIDFGELVRLVATWARATETAASPTPNAETTPDVEIAPENATGTAPAPVDAQAAFNLPASPNVHAAIDASASLNARALGDLEQLGGRDFVCEIATQFVADAVTILAALATAARDNDVARFRDEAHALRSCSANIGAQNLYELCLSWRQIGAPEFAANGAAYVADLEREFERVRADLTPYLEQAA